MKGATITSEDVAKWMVEQLQKDKYLYQNIVVFEICSKFGENFTPTNSSGNLSIEKKVLASFKKLTGDSVVWERGQRFWRRREPHDEPGRLQRY